MVKKLSKIILLLIPYIIICHTIYTYENKNITKTIINKQSLQGITPKKEIKKENKEFPIGKLIIKKIHLNQDLYGKNSSKNNIEENVTILKDSITPDYEKSIIFLAAHSGHGKIAYFKDIHKLKKDDLINLNYKGNNYYYQVKDIWESKKNGIINIQKETKNQLILTTCSKSKDKQLIINCIQK